MESLGPPRPEGEPSRLVRVARSLAVLGPLMVAAIVVGDMDLAGVAVAVAIAAVIVVAVLIWERRTGAR